MNTRPPASFCQNVRGGRREENRSWETEAEPVDIPEEAGIIKAAGKPPVVNKIPENPSVTGHIFKKAERPWP